MVYKLRNTSHMQQLLFVMPELQEWAYGCLLTVFAV